jgi:putative colanic acid biosysnthesis UDP-glucose lipid carrier transferase
MAYDDNDGTKTARSSSFMFIIKIIPLLQLVCDSIVLLLCGYLSYYLLVYYSYKTADYYTLAIMFNWVLTVMLMYFGGLYSFENIIGHGKTTDRIIIASLTSLILMISAAFTIKISSTYSRMWMGTFLITCIIFLIAERALVSWTVKKLSQRYSAAYGVVVYGAGPQVKEFLDYIAKANMRFINVSAVFLADHGKQDPETSGIHSSGDLESLIAHFRKGEIEDIIVSMPWDDEKSINAIVSRLRQLPANIYLSADIVGLHLPLRQPPGYFQKLPIFQLVGKPLSEGDVVLKQLMDYVLGALLLVVLSPFLLAIAALIKLDSSGPAIFKQKRHGFNNRNFEIYKFRTMTHSQNTPEKTVQATVNDARITRIGKILRKTSVDELPQLLNVLNGTMSLVGPRPHALDHNEEYAAKIRGYFSRHRVKPGITGLAQVKGFRGLTDTLSKMEGRVKYDMEYADSWSLLLDFKILILTMFIAIRGTNAF